MHNVLNVQQKFSFRNLHITIPTTYTTILITFIICASVVDLTLTMTFNIWIIRSHVACTVFLCKLYDYEIVLRSYFALCQDSLVKIQNTK